jgi:hypothetical protein
VWSNLAPLVKHSAGEGATAVHDDTLHTFLSTHTPCVCPVPMAHLRRDANPRTTPRVPVHSSCVVIRLQKATRGASQAPGYSLNSAKHAKQLQHGRASCAPATQSTRDETRAIFSGAAVRNTVAYKSRLPVHTWMSRIHHLKARRLTPESNSWHACIQNGSIRFTLKPHWIEASTGSSSHSHSLRSCAAR